MKEEYKIAVVDMDNTLFDFATPFYERAKVIMPSYPTPDEWDHWAVHKAVGMPDKTFYEIVKAVHDDQMMLNPFPGAKELMKALFRSYFVIVATHREPTWRNYNIVRDWLTINGLPFDYVYVGYNKVRLIDAYGPLVKVIFDDCPETIERCLARRVEPWTIEFPWNGDIEGCHYAKDMKDMAMTFKAVYNLNIQGDIIFSGRDTVHDNTSI